MNIKDMKIREVVVDMEFTLSELKLLKEALDNTTLDLAKIHNPDRKIAVDTVLNKFYSVLAEAVEGAERDGIAV